MPIVMINASQIQQRNNQQCSTKMINRLDLKREEMKIPWKELNKIAREVVGREFGDCRKLTDGEVKRLLEYLRVNWWTLVERYRKMIWH